MAGESSCQARTIRPLSSVVADKIMMTKEETNEGAFAALSQLTEWVLTEAPCCHIRFADGEFSSMLGRRGPNADGQEYLPDTLGRDLRETIMRIGFEQPDRCLVG